MNFTQSQLRQCIGLSKETYRHWRSKIPFLAEENGRSACFTANHLLATAILFEVTQKTGVGIGSMKSVSGFIFELCSESSWSSMESSFLLIDIHSNECELQRNSDNLSKDGVKIICPLKAVISNLRSELSVNQIFGDQDYLSFAGNPSTVTSTGN